MDCGINFSGKVHCFDMRRPPKLTKREISLVPYLLTGASRKDIADQIGVSEETVKSHIRNVIRKFDANTLRECFLELQAFNEFFNNNSSQGYEYWHDVRAELTISADGITAESTVTTEAEAMFGAIKSTAFPSGVDAGAIMLLEFNGNIIKHKTSLDTLHWYPFDFPEPIKDGTLFTTFMRLISKNSYLNPTETQNLSISRPTKVASIRVNFESGVVPKIAGVSVTAQGRSVEVPGLAIQRLESGLYLEIPDPKVYYWYSIIWTWDEPPSV